MHLQLSLEVSVVALYISAMDMCLTSSCFSYYHCRFSNVMILIDKCFE